VNKAVLHSSLEDSGVVIDAAHEESSGPNQDRNYDGKDDNKNEGNGIQVEVKTNHSRSRQYKHER